MEHWQGSAICLLTLWEANNSMIAKARAASTGIDDPYGESSAAAALGCRPREVFLASTGVIGEPLPRLSSGAAFMQPVVSEDDLRALN